MKTKTGKSVHARFYALLVKMPGATKEDIVTQYIESGSLSELLLNRPRDYERMIERMRQELSTTKIPDLDAHRKRLIAAIGGWLRAMGQKETISIIKAIACRAAKHDTFNSIPIEQLRSLYAAFGKKQKDLANVENMTVDMIDLLTRQN